MTLQTYQVTLQEAWSGYLKMVGFLKRQPPPRVIRARNTMVPMMHKPQRIFLLCGQHCRDPCSNESLVDVSTVWKWVGQKLIFHDNFLLVLHGSRSLLFKLALFLTKFYLVTVLVSAWYQTCLKEVARPACIKHLHSVPTKWI